MWLSYFVISYLIVFTLGMCYPQKATIGMIMKHIQKIILESKQSYFFLSYLKWFQFNFATDGICLLSHKERLRIKACWLENQTPLNFTSSFQTVFLHSSFALHPGFTLCLHSKLQITLKSICFPSPAISVERCLPPNSGLLANVWTLKMLCCTSIESTITNNEQCPLWFAKCIYVADFQRLFLLACNKREVVNCRRIHI